MARNEIRKLVASAINPMMGGPMRSPINPNEETAVNAVPGDSVFDFPAALYTMGTTDETPKPMKKKPMSAVVNCGINTATSNPVVVRMPLA